MGNNVKITSPIQIKDAVQIDTPRAKKYIVTTGLWLLGELIFLPLFRPTGTVFYFI